MACLTFDYGHSQRGLALKVTTPREGMTHERARRTRHPEAAAGRPCPRRVGPAAWAPPRMGPRLRRSPPRCPARGGADFGVIHGSRSLGRRSACHVALAACAANGPTRHSVHIGLAWTDPGRGPYALRRDRGVHKSRKCTVASPGLRRTRHLRPGEHSQAATGPSEGRPGHGGALRRRGLMPLATPGYAPLGQGPRRAGPPYSPILLPDPTPRSYSPALLARLRASARVRARPRRSRRTAAGWGCSRRAPAAWARGCRRRRARTTPAGQPRR